ncbi:ester cyclase [Microbacterium sp. SLBN-154]|uniref:ester cyclase n=1 Tax=Microbacterium sp. SLBN-154 TaxID=2768458 RepID=UPI00115248CB|nr:ester cyclase [Microbacterium sp. SLBN-154]
MEPWQMHEWFADYIDAANRHDLDAIRGFVHAEVRRAHRPAGVEAWVSDLDDLFHAFPDWRWRIIQVVAEDDRVAAHVRGSGTHTGVWEGIAPTRRHVNVAEFAVYTLAAGRVTAFSGSEPFELRLQLTEPRG